MHRTVVIFDLDHTLIDTLAIRRAIGVISSRLPEAATRIALDALARGTRHYVFDGVERMLVRLRERGDVDTALLTRGEVRWQQAKIDGSGLAKFFDEIVIVGDDKIPYLIRRAATARLVIVNDDGAETAAMRDAVPEAVYLLREGLKNADFKGIFARFRTSEEIGAAIDDAIAAVPA